MNELILGYCRLSKADKKKGRDTIQTSIDNQRSAIIMWAKMQNYKVRQIYSDEDISGSEIHRPDFDEMIQQAYILNKKGFEVIIVVKHSSRFGRDIVILKTHIRDFYAHGIKIFSLMQNKYLQEGDISDDIHYIVDEQKITDGKKEYKYLSDIKQQQSLPMTNPPFGYKWGKDKENQKVWMVDNKKANMVKAIYDLTVKKIPYNVICEEFGISQRTYYKIIKNRVYLGYIVYNKSIKDSKKDIIRKDVIEYKGNHKPIITQALYDKINK